MADPVTMMMVAGTVISAAGTIASGNAARDQANFAASEAERQAKTETAIAQRNAQEYDRNTTLTLSKLQNGAAGSGFSANDTGVLSLAGQIEDYGTQQARTARYVGEDKSVGLLAQAQADRLTGKAQQMGSYFQAGGTLLSGWGSTLSDKYGFGGPKGSSAAGGYGAYDSLFA